jgi:hypothetical protein
MNNLIPSIFGKQSLGLFVQMCETVTSEYVEEVTNQIIITGSAPSFEQLMDKVMALNNDLTLKVSWLRDNYKVERGRHSARLTKGCKALINKSTNDFLRTVKLIERQRSRLNTPAYAAYA